MNQVFARPKAMKEARTLYCPGCGHGVAHRLVAELVDEFGLRERAIGIAPVGCSVFADLYWKFDVISAAHGRAPAVATGMSLSCEPRNTIAGGIPLRMLCAGENCRQYSLTRL